MRVGLDLANGELGLSLELDGTGKRRGPGGLAIAAAVCALLPFFVHISFNGFDFVKLLGGALALLLGFIGVFRGVLRQPRRWAMASLSALAMVVGVAQLLLSGFAGAILTGVLDDTEAQARSELADRGMEAVELRGADGDFTFSAEHDGQYCMGSVTVSRELFASSSSVFYDCGLPMPVARLEQHCARGQGEACAEAADRYREQDPPDLVRALALGQRGCELGASSGCFAWGWSLEQERPGQPADPAGAVAAYGRGCEMGSPGSCFNRGVLLLHGTGVEHDPAAGCNSWERACELREESCGAYGECFRDGAGRPRDPARARALFHRGCEADNGAACTNEASTYYDSPEPDLARAFALYTRACERHDHVGCRMQARLQIEGPESVRDPQTGAERLAQMCEGGDAIGCFFGGVAFHNGSGPLEQDRDRALALFQKGCEGDQADSCRNVGVYLRDHIAGPQGTPEQARTAFARACQLGLRRACHER